jgi:hypothetical protein
VVGLSVSKVHQHQSTTDESPKENLMTNRQQLRLCVVDGYKFPNGTATPPEKWAKARPDPDFRSALETKLFVRMNERTTEQVRSELGYFLRGPNFTDEKRLAYACKGADELIRVEVHLQQLMVLAVRNGGEMAQEVMNHLQAHGLVQAFIDTVKYRLTELDWTCTPQHVEEMYILWQKFCHSDTPH